MSGPTTYLVCGDPDTGHRPGCDLALAETIAAEAMAHAETTGRPVLPRILAALAEVGILRDPPTGDPEGVHLALLDVLWECHLIGAPAREAGTVMTLCQWFALCTRVATGTQFHPILGDVPICDPCAAKVARLAASRPGGAR